MRHLDLSAPCGPHTPRTARLVRHLEARLLDFGPGGPEILAVSPEEGFITVRFPGHDLNAVMARLERKGILVCREDRRVNLYLSPQIPFEDLDYLWGCLFDILL